MLVSHEDRPIHHLLSGKQGKQNKERKTAARTMRCEKTDTVGTLFEKTETVGALFEKTDEAGALFETGMSDLEKQGI